MPAASARLPVVGAGSGRRRGGSPFRAAAPSITAALLYALALLIWLGVGDQLPGGRWFAVHLFTLGVLTNLVLTFSEHFARTLTHTAGERARWWPAVTNLAILLVLIGIPTRQRAVLVVGATVLSGVVLCGYLRLRRMRRAALGARFAWIVRVYERAHAAFLHGAVLGALLGVGLLPGAWYLAGRIAHLHANVLGWGGLTLLATLVFFGPTIARTRIESGADLRAARALRLGATGLSTAIALLVLTGVGGPASLAARIGAAVGLVAFAWAVTVVCLPVARAVRAAAPTASRPLILAVCWWFPVVAWADVLLVGAGAWRWLDGLGVAALTGVLAQAVLATLVYLAPMLRGRSTGDRETVRLRLEVGSRTRAVVFDTGSAIAVLGALRLTERLPIAGLGWSLLGLAVLSALVPALWPLALRDGSPTTNGSAPPVGRTEVRDPSERR
jgi:hypothetical protein